MDFTDPSQRSVDADDYEADVKLGDVEAEDLVE